MKTVFYRIAILLSLVCLASCTKEKEEVPVSSVSINQSTAEMIVGETVQLTATILPSDADEKNVVWSSSKQSVATISNSGLVTAVAEGSSTITASAGGKSGTCLITVSKKIIDVTSIELNKTTLSMVEGDSETLSATIRPADATDQTVTWSSSETGIATVEEGKVSAVSEGTATITAKAGGKTASCSVVVSKKVIAVESISLDKTSLTMTEGDQVTLTASVSPDNATDKAVSWFSSDEGVVSVKDGVVTAVKEGSSVVTAKAGDKMAECNVTVEKKQIPTESISFDRTYAAMLVGDILTIKVSVYPENSTEDISLISSSPDIVSVENGKMYALKEGVVTVFAYSGQCSTECKIAVVSSSTQAVDLGLSVKWGSMNLGASLPYESGSYYAWGEISPKTNYVWETYKWGNGGSLKLTKYVTESTYGKMDDRSILALEDDAAHVVLGDKWRLPTKEEQEELSSNADWTLTELHEVTGYVVTNKSTGKSIFIPAAGMIKETSTYNYGSQGSYWSSNFKLSSPLMAYYQWYSSASDKIGVIYDNYRCMGFPVRPVYGDPKEIKVQKISLDNSKLTLPLWEEVQLTAIVSPSDATDKNLTWTSSNESVAVVASGVVTAVSEGTTIIKASAGEVSAECTITVEKIVPDGAVDLGLSVYWGTCNIGASSAGGCGDYYAWGEIATKSTYSWSNYKWGYGSAQELTKYNTYSLYGTVDNKTTIEPEDDVAHKKLGGKWRMPSASEWEELKEGCTWVWSTINGMAGYLVKSNTNGNSIFLPAAGLRTEKLSFAICSGEDGRYWSSSLSPGVYYPTDAQAMSFSSNYVSAGAAQERFYGFPIRPVSK